MASMSEYMPRQSFPPHHPNHSLNHNIHSNNNNSQNSHNSNNNKWTWQNSNSSCIKPELSPPAMQRIPSTYSSRNGSWEVRGTTTPSNLHNPAPQMYSHQIQNRPTPVYTNGIPSPYSDMFSSTSGSFGCVSPAQTPSNVAPANAYFNMANGVSISLPVSPELEGMSRHNSLATSSWESHMFEPIISDASPHKQANMQSEWQNGHSMVKTKSTSPITKPSSTSSRPKPRRIRTEANERDSRSWKAAHNLVERNYRDRLNDQIAELSNILFESTDDAKGSKPPKSLVISRAKDKLRELATQNKDLLGEVEKLKQHIAVLDHVARSNVNTTPVSDGSPGRSGWDNSQCQ